jgi:Flp pilus assembly pilin Flp
MGMMKRWSDGMAAFWRDEAATTTLEYALLLALVTLSAVAGYRSLGNSVGDGVGEGQKGVASAGSPGVGGPGETGGYGAAAPG